MTSHISVNTTPPTAPLGRIFRAIHASRLGALLGVWLLGPLLASGALAQGAEEGASAGELVYGQPTPGAIGLQPAASPIMEGIAVFNTFTLYIILAIFAFVCILVLWCILRFNEKANPEPSKTSHNTLLEVIWTAVPIIILVVIAVPSFRLLPEQLLTPDGNRKYLGANIFSSRDNGTVLPAPSLTVDVVGNPSWSWTYRYPDHNIEFDSLMLSDSERKPGDPRLLAVDNPMVVPVNKVVRLYISSDPIGMIHGFAVPAFGIKIDANPGRRNETWFMAQRTGMFYGQCSELCGKDHAFMPIAVKVVTDEEFAQWVVSAQQEFSAGLVPPRATGKAVVAGRAF